MEARWTGTNFEYHRRLGGIVLEDLASVDGALSGIAYTANGNWDVQHPVTLPKAQRERTRDLVLAGMLLELL